MHLSVTYHRSSSSWQTPVLSKLGIKNPACRFVWLALFSLWGILMSTNVDAQAIQWSQFTGPNTVNPVQPNNVYALERAPDGSLYILGYMNGPGGRQKFPTSDVDYLGDSKGTDGFRIFLSKYSADGSRLIWVRVISNNTNVFPAGLSLDAAGEPTILYHINDPISEVTTANAWQPNPPPVFQPQGVVGGAALLNKFDANGNLTYGTYIGPENGSLTFFASNGNNRGTNFNTVFTTADGYTYVTCFLSKTGTQTGKMPTTANAFQTDMAAGSTGAVMVMIFKPDNSLAYSSYFSTDATRNLAHSAAMGPNGDLYVMMSGSGLQLANLPVPTTTAAEPTTVATGTGIIMRFTKTGAITSTYKSGYTTALTTNPITGDLVVAERAMREITVFDAGLTTTKSVTTPFGTPSGDLGSPMQMAVDKIGRLHVLLTSGSIAAPTKEGAVQSTADKAQTRNYYGIIDCSLTKLAYGTYLSSQNSLSTAADRSNDIELDDNCNAYIGGSSTYSAGFPITPIAYNDAGTATVSGYDMLPTTAAVNDGWLMKFNYPTLKAGTNQLATPANSTLCSDMSVLPIDGTTPKFITPTLLGVSDGNPAPVPTNYQWERATSAAGPWTVIAGVDTEDYSPEAPGAPGTYYYRRKLRQTPWDNSCAPSCDVESISNIISLTFNSNKTHKTNLTDKTYAFCKGSSVSLSTTVTPGADGAQAPYTYKLTTMSNLTATVMGQSGTVSASPYTINLANINQEGKFLLQVSDSRGCVSFDTLTVEFLNVDAGPRTMFTCGKASLTFGPGGAPSQYANYASNVLSWSPGTGLSNASILSPTLAGSGFPAADASLDYVLSLNGCPVDTITVTNKSLAALPALADISRCQGDSAMLGRQITAQTGVTYQWVPGLGLTSTNSHTAVLTTLSAPAGVNVTTYTLLASAGTTGCTATTTQKVTVYRTPNQSFQIKECLFNSNNLTKPMGFSTIGTVSEPGISYTWQAVLLSGSATSGLPTTTDITSGLSNPTGAMTNLTFATAGTGRANAGYEFLLIRTSANAANPACSRADTAFLSYCNGPGAGCSLALGAVPTIACGGPENKIGSPLYASGGTYVWSRKDGQPLNNELFDPVTKLPLTAGGPHPSQVIANPGGVQSVAYNLTLYGRGGDTCRIDITVFPGAVGKPTVSYISPQAVCGGNLYTVTGQNLNPALTYKWEPSALMSTPADTGKSQPVLKPLTKDDQVFVTVTDPSTGCFVKDTVKLVVSPVIVEAGTSVSFCVGGATVDIGGGQPTSGYTYKWSAKPAAGVTFASSTSAQTTATLPATAAGGKITLYLSATNAAGGCSAVDSVILTAAAAPAITVAAVSPICAGGKVTISLNTPLSGVTYAWTGSGIVGSATGSSIEVNAAGVYAVEVSQGSCSGTKSVTVAVATPPTVSPDPTSVCSGPAVIGVNNTPSSGWTYTWDKLDGIKAYDKDFSNISVEPTVTTTYTLEAVHVSGCTLTFPITVPAAAYSATLPAIIKLCEGGANVLSLNTPPSGATVAWTAESPAALAYLSSATAPQPTINMANAVSGQYSYTATVTYGAGCTSFAATKVTIGKKSVNIAGLDADICLGLCQKIGSPLESGIVYGWSSTPTDSTLLNINEAQVTVCPKQTTTYTLNYRVYGCAFSDDVTLTVLPTPTLTVKDITACGPVTADLATAIVATTGSTKTYWLNAAATVAAVNPVSQPGTYYVKSADASCSVTKPVKVSFADLPNGTLDGFYSCSTRKGVLQISNVTAGARFAYSTGTTYSGSVTTFAGASVIMGGGILSSSLPTPPTGGQSYTVRLFSANSSCYQDVTVNLTSTCVDPCPTGNCYPTRITKN